MLYLSGSLLISLALIESSFDGFSVIIDIKDLFNLKVTESICVLKYNFDFNIINSFDLSHYFKSFNFLGNLQPMYNVDFSSYKDISILYRSNSKLDETVIYLFIPHQYRFIPNLFDIWWQICIVLYKFFNSPLIKLLLLGLLYYFIVLLKIMCNKIFSRLVLFIIFFSRVIGVNAFPVARNAAISERNILVILFTLGNFFFFLINWWFDYWSFAIKDRTIFNKVKLGLLFLLNIVFGVLASDGLYYYNHSKYNGILYTVITFFSTVLFSALWFKMSVSPDNPDNAIINSSFRAILEVLTFNSAAWFTFDLWALWIKAVNNNPFLLALIFLPFYLLVGTVLIYMEMRGAENKGPLYLFGYGICYVLNFTFIAFFTNALYGFYYMHISYNFIRYFIMILSAIITVIFFPDIYREKRKITVNVEDNNFWSSALVRAFILCLHYLLVFTAFVFLTGILFWYINP